MDKFIVIYLEGELNLYTLAVDKYLIHIRLTTYSKPA